MNLTQETWEQVADRIEGCEGPVAWSWLAALEQGEWQLLVLAVRGATEIEEHLDRYANVILCTEQLSSENAAERFRAGQTGGRFEPPFVFGPMSERASTSWLTTERSGLRQFSSEWPRYYAEFHIRTNGSPGLGGRYDPLTAPGERFHADAMAAVSEMIHGVPPDVLRNDLSTAVRIVLPDRRARFGEITFSGGRTEVAVEEGRRGSAAGLLLRAAWRDNPRDSQWKRLDVPMTGERTVEIPTELVPAQMSMIITTREGATLDQRAWSPEHGSRPIDRDVPSEQVERWLTEGEHQTLEFKRELDGDSAKRAFAEVVCAFANSAGGTILVGVDDDRTVIGYDRPFAVADQIQNVIRNSVNTPPSVDVRCVITRGMPVYLVSVEPSPPERKPHMVGTEVWLRAGGTTFRATPDELRQLLTPPVERRAGLGLWG